MNRQQVRMAVLAATLGLFSAANALADGFYTGISGGVSMPDLPSKGQFDAAVGAAISRSSLDDTGESWGVQIGYRWGQHVAAEVGYVDFGKAEYEADLAGTNVRASTRFRSFGPTASVLGIFPLAGGMFDLHGRAGILFADTRVRVKAEDLVTGVTLSSEPKASSTDLFAGIGGVWNINESFSVRFEYQKFFDVGDEDNTGEQDIDLITLGILFR